MRYRVASQVNILLRLKDELEKAHKHIRNAYSEIEKAQSLVGAVKIYGFGITEGEREALDKVYDKIDEAKDTIVKAYYKSSEFIHTH